MIDLWMVALLHTVGSVGVFAALALDVWRKHRDMFAVAIRVVLCLWFLRYAGALWVTAGYGARWLSWTTNPNALFTAGFTVYMVFLIADRHRWSHAKGT